ncbi:MAG: response regulator transcription factor [Saprospiraceae bacterium]|nr:response regulator transcription factor [Saprospiraceae bacterium]
MIRVAIVDDHMMFVDGIESILSNENHIDLISKYHSGKDLMDAISHLNIDVLLLDINLPDMSGIELCKTINDQNPNIHILTLSMYSDKSIVTEILKNGAIGYILKNTSSNELIEAIETVSKGQTYFSKEITETIMAGLSSDKNTKKSKYAIYPKLTRREREVLELIVKEYTTHDIAKSLFISLKTVETHRSSLISKLNVKNSAGLVRAAYEQKLI